jgi:RNA polymerase-binding transcription factor DksA
MDIATQTHLHSLRSALEFRLGQLQDEVRTAELAARDEAGSPGHEAGDLEDEAAHRLASEVAGAEEQRDFDELALVQAALHRLDDGVYGDCLDCGEPIPLKRLSVQPAAERCAACQSVFEARRSR